MSKIRLSIAGIETLLGQSLLNKMTQDADITIESLHGDLGDLTATDTAQISGWQLDAQARAACAAIPILSPEAPSLAPLMVSFLPDSSGRTIEAQHLARGTQVISHCEYAREIAPLCLPGVTQPPHENTALLSTPNCTTAICAAPLLALHAAFGITRTTITTMQAISGTDLPGLPASAIHNQIVGHLEGEVEALTNELGLLFQDAFAVDVFATRVPIWQGHTITVAVDLDKKADKQTIQETLSAHPDICVLDKIEGRDRFAPDAPLSTVAHLRTTPRGVLFVLKGDNLEAATAGIMHRIVKSLPPQN